MAETQIHIAASTSHVWSILTDFSSWDQFQGFVANARLLEPAPPKLDSSVGFTTHLEGARPINNTVRLTTWEPEKEFAWKGGPLPAYLQWLAMGHHWFKIRPEGEGTVFDHGEAVSGLLTYFVPKGMVAKVKKGLEDFNEGLKKYAESN